MSTDFFLCRPPRSLIVIINNLYFFINNRYAIRTPAVVALQLITTL